MAVKIDTGKVVTAASQIATVNRQITSDFSAVESAIRRMDSSWDGSASEAAKDKFYHIKRSFYERRSVVVNDMVNFMMRQVGEGYESTEGALVSAASAFK